MNSSEPEIVVIKKCPMCKRIFTGVMLVCSHDGTLLMKPREETRGMKCPTCLRCYGVTERTCPHDSSELMLMILNQENSRTTDFSEKHDVLSVLSTGTTTAVYSGIDKQLGRGVAIKVLLVNENHPQYLLKIKRFSRQIEAHAKLHHPNIIKLLQVGTSYRGQSYLAYELVRDGFSLANLTGQLSALPLNYFVEIFMQVCDALEYAAGQGVLHQDLSSGDILIAEIEGDSLNIQITDFAKGTPLLHGDNRSQQFTEVGDLFGHPEFMSPEVCQGAEIDERATVYSLGYIMYCSLSVKKPFRGSHWAALMLNKIHEDRRPLIMERNDKATGVIKNLVNRCLQVNPEDRFQSITELKNSLAKLPVESGKTTYSELRSKFKEVETAFEPEENF